jgi:probable selenium-dependent hydroxylase accessory protein YqeC
MKIQESLALEQTGVISIVGAGGKTSLMYALARELGEAGKKVLTTTTTMIFPPSGAQSEATLVGRHAGEILERAGALLKTHAHLTAASQYLPADGKLKGVDPAAVETIAEAELFDFIIVEADGAAGRSLKACAPHEPVVPRCSDRVVAVAGLDAVGKPLTEELVLRSAIFSRLTGLELSGKITEAAIAAALCHDMASISVSTRGSLKIAFLNKADSPEMLEAGRRLTTAIEHRKEAVFDRIIIGELREKPMIYRCCAPQQRRAS